MELVTVAELADYLELDAPPADSPEERRARHLIAGVSGLVLGELHRESLAPAEREVLVDGTGAPTLLLPGDHVLDVLEVLEDPDAAEPTVLVAGEHVEWSSSGILRRLDGGIFVRRFRFYAVTFEEGLTAAEIDAVKLVVERVAARAVVNPEGLATEGTGGYNAGFAFDESRLPTLAAPDRRDLARMALRS